MYICVCNYYRRSHNFETQRYTQIRSFFSKNGLGTVAAWDRETNSDRDRDTDDELNDMATINTITNALVISNHHIDHDKDDHEQKTSDV